MKERAPNSIGKLFLALLASDDTTGQVGTNLSEVFAGTKPAKLVIVECEGDGQRIGGVTPNWWVADAGGVHFKQKLPYPDSFDGDELFRTFPMVKFSLGSDVIRFQIRMGFGNNICVQAKFQVQGERLAFCSFQPVYRHQG